MGEQIHIGGLSSTLELAEKAGLKEEYRGIDLCCCTGAGMRALVRYLNITSMTGVDATEAVVELGQKRTAAEELTGRIRFVLADVTASGIPDADADFVWGEDAWCYVENKDKLIAEAARLVKKGGRIAFTDWVEGPSGLTDQEAERFLKFMKFPNVQDIPGYRSLLENYGCEVLAAEDTQKFASAVDLYLDMLNNQFTHDALKIIGFDKDLMNAMAQEMVFMGELAHNGKIAQGRFVAQKG